MDYRLSELDEEILKIRVQLEKESNKELKKILLEQKKYLEQIRGFVGSLYMEFGEELDMTFGEQYNVRRELEKELVEVKNKLSIFEIGVIGGILLKSYVNGYYKTANIINKGLGVSVNINYKLLRPEFIESVINANFEGRNFSDRIWKNKDWLVNKLYNVTWDNITKGHSIDKMAKEIKEIFGSSAYQSKRLVRNELSRVVSEAQDEIYKDSGVVEELLFVSTLDNRTTEICQNLDGNRYKLTDNYPKIPSETHIQCRSCYSPIVSGWNPSKRRDNITKENIKYQNYEDWIKDKGIDI